MLFGQLGLLLSLQPSISGVCHTEYYLTIIDFRRIEMADPAKVRMTTALRLGGFLGFVGGFLLAYQRSSGKQDNNSLSSSNNRCLSVRFWGWSENKREELMDLEELSQRAKEGKPLYGESFQPQWVQGAAFKNSAYSQLKFCKSVAFENVIMLLTHICSRIPNVRNKKTPCIMTDHAK